MKGYKFYAEFSSNKEKRKWTRDKLSKDNKYHNCLATYGETWIENKNIIIEAISSVMEIENSSCQTTNCYINYIRYNCTRISESLARRLHPNLSKYLEYDTSNSSKRT